MICTPFLRAPWLLLGLWVLGVGGLYTFAAGQDTVIYLLDQTHAFLTRPDPPVQPAAPAPDAAPATPAPQQSAFVRQLARIGDGAPEHVASVAKPPSVTNHVLRAFTAEEQMQPAAQTGEQTTQKAQAQVRSFTTRFVLDAPVGTPSISHVTVPVPAWVVDVKGSWKSLVPARTELDGQLIRRIDVGVHRDYLRLVLYCSKGKDCSNEQKPVIRQTDDGFAVTINEAVQKPSK